MGGAAPEPGKGGKRALDAAINLVPYIDLLMTIMTFLVMTAVWTQIAALEV
jgi:biopolymer transport protein ExbD